jgi:hypothetical protein
MRTMLFDVTVRDAHVIRDRAYSVARAISAA